MKHANMHKIISQLSARLTWESLHLFEGSGGAKRWREREGKKKEIQETCQFLLPSYFADCLQRQTAILFHYVGFLN